MFAKLIKNRMWCEKTTSNFYRKSVYIFEEKNQNTAELSFINIQTIISEDSNVMVVCNYHLLIMLVLHWSKKLSEMFIWIWTNLNTSYIMINKRNSLTLYHSLIFKSQDNALNWVMMRCQISFVENLDIWKFYCVCHVL